jgi:hypothetical protein
MARYSRRDIADHRPAPSSTPAPSRSRDPRVVDRPTDLVAAITVPGRRDTSHDAPKARVDLSYANLAGLYLVGVNLAGVRVRPAGRSLRRRRVGVLAGRVGGLAGQVGILAGRVGILAGRVGILAGRVGILAGRVGVLAGRVGILAGPVGILVGPVAVAVQRLDEAQADRVQQELAEATASG